MSVESFAFLPLQNLDHDDLDLQKKKKLTGYMDVNRISGYIPGKIVFFLMQVCKAGVARVRKIWLTRHGESEYNLGGKLGGDSPLSARGEAYARLLPDVIVERVPLTSDGGTMPVSVWTSTLVRTIQTAELLPFPKLRWKVLDEIQAGAFDGWTYAQVEAEHPSEFAARKRDKLRYRYPAGESYMVSWCVLRGFPFFFRVFSPPFSPQPRFFPVLRGKKKLQKTGRRPAPRARGHRGRARARVRLRRGSPGHPARSLRLFHQDPPARHPAPRGAAAHSDRAGAEARRAHGGGARRDRRRHGPREPGASPGRERSHRVDSVEPRERGDPGDARGLSPLGFPRRRRGRRLQRGSGGGGGSGGRGSRGARDGSCCVRGSAASLILPPARVSLWARLGVCRARRRRGKRGECCGGGNRGRCFCGRGSCRRRARRARSLCRRGSAAAASGLCCCCCLASVSLPHRKQRRRKRRIRGCRRRLQERRERPRACRRRRRLVSLAASFHFGALAAAAPRSCFRRFLFFFARGSAPAEGSLFERPREPREERAELGARGEERKGQGEERRRRRWRALERSSLLLFIPCLFSTSYHCINTSNSFDDTSL